MIFTVITPVYNGSKYLEEVILSIQNQTYFNNIEHIIINDGSNDGGATQNIIDRYPHLIARSRNNIGQYATINEAMLMATGDFLVIICADDLFYDNHVFEKVYEALMDSGAEVLYGRTARITEAGDIIEFDGIVIKEPFPKWRFKYQLPLLHCSAFIKRSFLIKNSLYFDHETFRYAADWDWFLRMSLLADFKFLDLIISKYRVHSNQTTNTVGKKALKMEDTLVLKKNGSSILLYYLVINFERLRKAYFLIKEGGFKALYMKVALLIK
jgi:glycosyltransferase involved in cell wall biosynthesis